MPPPNENKRKADRATGIAVQNEEAVGGTERAIGTEEGVIVTGVIHWTMVPNLQLSLAINLSSGMLSVSIRRLSVRIKDCTPQ